MLGAKKKSFTKFPTKSFFSGIKISALDAATVNSSGNLPNCSRSEPLQIFANNEHQVCGTKSSLGIH
jgi:hypothetical protein